MKRQRPCSRLNAINIGRLRVWQRIRFQLRVPTWHITAELTAQRRPYDADISRLELTFVGYKDTRRPTLVQQSTLDDRALAVADDDQ